MKKKFFMAAALTVAAVSGAIYGHLSQNASDDSDMLLANAEALTHDESNDPIWIIDPYDCTISAELAAKLGLSLKGEGTLTVSGARDCFTEGTAMCTPISCIDIYQALK